MTKTKTAAKKAITDVLADMPEAQLDPIEQVMTGECPSLSGASTLTYAIGKLGSDEYSLSQMYIAIDAKRIAGEDYLAAAINEVLDNLHDSVPVDPAQPVRYPGENSLAIRNANLANGIPVDDKVWEKIKSF